MHAFVACVFRTTPRHIDRGQPGSCRVSKGPKLGLRQCTSRLQRLCVTRATALAQAHPHIVLAAAAAGMLVAHQDFKLLQCPIIQQIVPSSPRSLAAGIRVVSGSTHYVCIVLLQAAWQAVLQVDRWAACSAEASIDDSCRVFSVSRAARV
jgi:hypothetical protein